MKFILVLSALTLSIGTFGTGTFAWADPSGSQIMLAHYQQQIGFQKRVVLEETRALDQAIKNRDSQVHLTKGLLDTLAYGVSSGFLTYDFLNNTGRLKNVRNYLVREKVPPEIIPPGQAAAVTEDSAIESESLARELGMATFRTAEIGSAAALAIFFVGNAYDTGKDVVVKFKDTDEIRMHRAKLNKAAKRLDVAEQNLKVAVLSEQ